MLLVVVVVLGSLTTSVRFEVWIVISRLLLLVVFIFKTTLVIRLEILTLISTSLVGAICVKRFTSFGVFNFNLPVVKRSLPVHFFNGLSSLFLLGVCNVSKSAGITSLVILDNLNLFYLTKLWKNFSKSIFVSPSRYPSNINNTLGILNGGLTRITVFFHNQLLFRSSIYRWIRCPLVDYRWLYGWRRGWTKYYF